MVAQRQELSKRKTERPKCNNSVCRREVSSCTKSCRSSSRTIFLPAQRVFLPFPLVVELPVGPVLWCESISLHRMTINLLPRIRLAAYQSWTLLTSLPVTLFYFSIWKLALAGPEFSSVTALSPLFLGFTPVLSFAVSRGGRTVFAGAAGAIGIGLWRAESMWVRLAAAMFGVFCTSIRWAGEWQSDINRGYHAIGI
jgi:hypothetical protein